MEVFGFAGYSGSGKTTLIEQLIPLFVAEGLKISLIKHTHHNFAIDQPGKDSYRHRAAGCSEVMVTSQYRWTLVHELRNEPEPSLKEQLARLAPCDLVLVESFKNEAIAKLEVHRTTIDKALLFPQDPNIAAIASDLPLETSLPQFRLNQPKIIAEFILQQTGLKQNG
ncbi:molybdopterin-guanine dinucleotide biosynthesis protein MobB [Sulfuricella denitrificans skB26]|uniref:Molybdopterin-guanine dinucleotide biosynthesis protein MobB n=1 Tax=Sulfuricella denitrificans (strain DSM 22764 / NBRC 105220 / skB26) TaxID=1163617 RepID=S6ABY1_SULDS|nr:molybdopterin-guanine dinucleotide biosynthesis protein B [Sulfuricella denitrificans]BAN35103.1 molybdopterin-guanine dinucleotide biosynthesis protein MobB [Sulfuricella denitrificans skB26]